MRTLAHLGAAYQAAPGDAAFDAAMEAMGTAPGADAADRALLAFVARLTLLPGTMTSAEVERLRAAGFDDREVHDIVQVACCFAYMNRLADGTGVTLLPHQHPFAIELLGEEALRTHLAWGER